MWICCKRQPRSHLWPNDLRDTSCYTLKMNGRGSKSHTGDLTTACRASQRPQASCTKMQGFVKDPLKPRVLRKHHRLHHAAATLRGRAAAPRRPHSTAQAPSVCMLQSLCNCRTLLIVCERHKQHIRGSERHPGITPPPPPALLACCEAFIFTRAPKLRHQNCAHTGQNCAHTQASVSGLQSFHPYRGFTAADVAF